MSEGSSSPRSKIVRTGRPGAVKVPLGDPLIVRRWFSSSHANEIPCLILVPMHSVYGLPWSLSRYLLTALRPSS